MPKTKHPSPDGKGTDYTTAAPRTHDIGRTESESSVGGVTPASQAQPEEPVDQKSEVDVADVPVTRAVVGKPFEKGRSGNPSGRPKGARNKATLLSEAVLEDNAEALAEKLVAVALSGEVPALALCMKYLLPVMRKRTIELDLPPLVTIEDGLQIVTIVMRAVAQGEISIEDAQQLTVLVDLHRRILETVDFEARLQRLEVAHKKRQAWEQEND